MRTRHQVALTFLALLAGCQSVPTGPSVMVLPGQGQGFERFTHDDASCRRFASFQTGNKTPAQASAETGLASAAVGTAVGAASGAAFGGAPGAAIGAGAGLLGGSAVGTGLGYESGIEQQNRYDQAYIQCMYGHGHQVPINGVIIRPTPTSPTTRTQGLPLPPAVGDVAVPSSSKAVSHDHLALPPP